MKSYFLRYLAVFSAMVILFFAVCGFLPGEDDLAVYENTIRLHVIAASDSEHDQAVKLAVRDAVLREMQALLADADTPDSAARVLGESLDRIRAVCNETLDTLGESARATVLFSAEHYPTRHYAELQLPAGTYRSLRVEIGAAEGKNWWCVLYPALCTNMAKTEAALSKTGFSPEQIEVLTGGEKPKYKLKFKILELFGESLSE